MRITSEIKERALMLATMRLKRESLASVLWYAEMLLALYVEMRGCGMDVVCRGDEVPMEERAGAGEEEGGAGLEKTGIMIAGVGCCQGQLMVAGQASC
jgi:hypothetical protein